jgi:hypothetical protein
VQAPAPRAALLAGLLTLLTATAVGLHSSHPKPLPVPAPAAVRIASQAPAIRADAARATATAVERVDAGLERVTFLRHGRVVASAGVTRDRTVYQPVGAMRHQGYGTPLAHAPLAFLAVTLVFLAAVLRRPLRQVGTADRLALAGFVVPTVLADRGYVLPAQGTAALLLACIAARAVWILAHGAPVTPVGRPLLDMRSAPRLPVLLAGALTLAIVGMTLCSTGEVDVAFANMEGATKLLHGVLPYGHLPGDVVHGDTYGLPSYAAYVPVAALWPVTSTWDEVTGALVLAAMFALATAWGLAQALGGDRATALLIAFAFPPALLSITSGTNDVLIAAALAWALAWSARAGRSTALVTLAGLAKIAPLALVPAWIARTRGRARLRAIGASAAVCGAVLALLLALGGPQGPLDMLHAIGFQAERRSLNSVYLAFGIEAVQPLVQALTVAIAVAGATFLALDDDAAADPRRLAALAAAVLAMLQLAAHYWAPLYLLWLLPPAALALLGHDAREPAAVGLTPGRFKMSRDAIRGSRTGAGAAVAG